jgi:glycosyltransferase involved in cell wall biosynthesis
MSGVERAVRSVLPELARQGDRRNITVVYPRCLPRPSGASERFRYVAPLTPNRPRLLRILWQQAALPWRLRRAGADLLHAPAYTAPLCTPTPTVLTIYDAIALRFPRLCKTSNVLHYRLVMPRAARRAARIIVPSACTRRDVVRLLRVPEAKVRVIPLGVGEAFRPVTAPHVLEALRRRYGLPERFILFLGNLEPKKNLPRLLTAFAEARGRGRLTHRLVLAGQKAWHTRAIRRALRTHRLHRMAMLLGAIPEEDLPALYSAASMLVFPSLYEGFGLPPLEAMACGTPVIASTAGALPEVVGEAALLLRPSDVAGLRTAMIKVAHNAFLRRRLGELGRARAAKYTWAETARRTLDVYDDVLAESGFEVGK